VLASPDLKLTGAVSRSCRGQTLRQAFGLESDLMIHAAVADALEQASVLVDFTSPAVVLHHVFTALERGVHVVIGTSGITDEQYQEIHHRAVEAHVGVLAAGNFALTAVLLQRFATKAAKYIPSWEILDYAHADKIDAPSGTARELAFRLSQVRPPHVEVPLDRMNGIRESRGAAVQQTQVHSIRLPGFVISAEVIFGLPEERLQLRHDAGSGAAPYVGGTLLAIREVARLRGVHRGLDCVMDL